MCKNRRPLVAVTTTPISIPLPNSVVVSRSASITETFPKNILRYRIAILIGLRGIVYIKFMMILRVQLLATEAPALLSFLATHGMTFIGQVTASGVQSVSFIKL